jgi:hypothetical protein
LLLGSIAASRYDGTLEDNTDEETRECRTAF